MYVYCSYSSIRKRLQRAKFDINESSVKSIDQLFHSRLYCFKVSYRPEDANEKKVSAVFAAEDEDSLNYWLVSFEDCEIYYHTHGGDKKHAAGPADTPVVAESTARAQPSKAAPVIASGGGTSEVGSDIGSGGSGGGKISPADLANALRKRGGGMAAEPKDEGEDKYDDTYTNSKNNKPVSTAAHANPLVAALHSRFASAPANVPQHPHQGEDPSSAAVEVDHSASTESLQYNDQLLRVNTMNMDTLLSMPNKQVSNLQEPLVMEVAAPLPAAPAPLSAADSAVSKLKFSVKRVKYPSERLSRRIKIWYCSSGFSIASVSEVEQFVAELRNTGDAVLSSFAEEKFGDLQDWANLLAVLRKYEQRRVIDSPVGGPTHQALDGITFEIDSVAPVEGDSGENKQLAPFNLRSDLNTAAIATQVRFRLCYFLCNILLEITHCLDVVDLLFAQISKELGASESLLAQELPRMLLSQEDNVVSQGLILLNEDLAFAEDLILVRASLSLIYFDSFPSYSPLVPAPFSSFFFLTVCSTKRK